MKSVLNLSWFAAPTVLLASCLVIPMAAQAGCSLSELQQSACKMSTLQQAIESSNTQTGQFFSAACHTTNPNLLNLDLLMEETKRAEVEADVSITSKGQAQDQALILWNSTENQMAGIRSEFISCDITRVSQKMKGSTMTLQEIIEQMRRK